MTDSTARTTAARLARVLDRYATGDGDASTQVWRLDQVPQDLIALANHFMALVGRQPREG